MGQVKYLTDKEDYKGLTSIEKLALNFIEQNKGATRNELKGYLTSISGDELQNVLLTLIEKDFLKYQII